MASSPDGYGLVRSYILSYSVLGDPDPTKIRLGLFAASPVYYQTPLYQRLAADPRIDFTAIFASDQGARRPCENEYAKADEWGVDPLAGYTSIFLSRASTNPIAGTTFSLRDYDIAPLIWRSDFEVLWLHGYHTVTHVLAAITQKAKHLPLLYREEQTLLTPRPRWKTALKHVGVRALLHGSYGLFIGTENRRWFERWGMPRARLFHVPYAADGTTLMASAPVSRDEARASFGISPDGGPVVAVVGRLMAKKQPLLVLDAFARTREQHPCTLLIAGSGAYEDALRERVATNGIRDVVFAGFLDQRQIGRAYRAADVLLLASAYDETWGLVVNEAMSFGVPPVVSDRVGCGQDLVLPGETGFRFRHDDPDEFVDRLLCLVADERLRSTMGERAAKHVRSWNYEAATAGVLAAVHASVGEARWQKAEREHAQAQSAGSR